MSKTFKIVLLLLVVVSIVSALAAVFAFIGKEREYTKRLLLEYKLAATLKDRKRLEGEIELGKKAKEELDAKIKDLDKKMRELLAEVEEEREKTKSVMLDISTKEEEIAELKDTLEKEKDEKMSISKKLQELEFTHAKTKTEIARLKEEKAELEKKVSDLKEKSVDLDTIVVNPTPPATVSPMPVQPQGPAHKELLQGKVLVVNKDYNFIVTDLGQDDGIQKGMIFEVRDITESLGKAEIDKVYDTMSSATILPGSTISGMKKGNLIIESR